MLHVYFIHVTCRLSTSSSVSFYEDLWCRLSISGWQNRQSFMVVASAISLQKYLVPHSKSKKHTVYFRLTCLKEIGWSLSPFALPLCRYGSQITPIINFYSVLGATLQSWIHEGTEMIFVRCVSHYVPMLWHTYKQTYITLIHITFLPVYTM